LLVDGLTLAGARRRMEAHTSAPADAPEIDGLIGENARERLTAVKVGLRSILELLDGEGREDFTLAPPPAETPAPVRTMPASRAKPSRGSAASGPESGGNGSARAPHARRR